MAEFRWFIILIAGIMISFVIVGIYYIYQNHNSLSDEDSKTVKESIPPEILNDSNGIPFVYYGNTTGYQRNPVTTSEALSYYCGTFIQTDNVTQLQYLKNNANWLVDNARQYGNYSLLEYNFPYRYNLSPPWHSALAQGLAIQALTKAYKITNNDTYLDATALLLNSFYVDVKDGGITEKTNNSGWWYEEYAGNGSENPRVLNGMMLDLLALHDYNNSTGSKQANYLFNQGVLALKNNIDTYDNNGSSYYDSLKFPATPFYQKLHVDLLDKLYKITGEPILKKYHDKWKSYLESQVNSTLTLQKSREIQDIS